MDLQKLINQVVIFTDKVTEIESDFSPGVKGKVLSFQVHEAGTKDEYYVLQIQLKGYEVENMAKWERIYYDKDHNPTLIFPETNMYKDITSFYVSTQELMDFVYFKLETDIFAEQEKKAQLDQTTKDIYWAMLREIESHCAAGDVLNRMLVESAYRHWNALHPENKPLIPNWM